MNKRVERSSGGLASKQLVTVTLKSVVCRCYQDAVIAVSAALFCDLAELRWMSSDIDIYHVGPFSWK